MDGKSRQVEGRGRAARGSGQEGAGERTAEGSGGDRRVGGGVEQTSEAREGEGACQHLTGNQPPAAEIADPRKVKRESAAVVPPSRLQHPWQSRTDEAIICFEKGRSAVPGIPFHHSRLASAYVRSRGDWKNRRGPSDGVLPIRLK